MDEDLRGVSPRFRIVFLIAKRSMTHDVTLSEVTQCTQLWREADSAGLEFYDLMAVRGAVETVRLKFQQQPSRCPSTPPPPSSIPPEEATPSSPPAPPESPPAPPQS